MRKMLLGLALAGTLAAFGAADDTLVAFSTVGPDRYADGTVVPDGERYALVWTAGGAAFAGLAADGTAVGEGSRVLVFASLAKGGRCPATLFELDAGLASACAGGTFSLYLVDTRVVGADGVLRLGGTTAAGLPAAVNGYGKVEGASVSVTARSAVPEGVPQPVVTGIRVDGDRVLLTVRGTVSCLRYAAHSVGIGAGASAGAAGSPAQGASSVDGEITVVAPRTGDRGFFAVGRE